MCLLGLTAGCFLARAQGNANADANAAPPPDPQRWNLFWQATSVGQLHGSFYAAYSGPLSLSNHFESEASLTTTFFLTLRLTRNTQLIFNPEIAGGRGFSGVNGLANASNGELPRVAQSAPTPYLARLYVSHDFGFGDETESVDADANQLGGSRPETRYTIAAGRFSLTDFFDQNNFTHDPRTQFLGWAVMYNGAWDYPADTRGYTWGWVHEFHRRWWSIRYASAAEPKVANGLRFDRRLFVDRGDVFEGEARFHPFSHPGAVRALSYLNHTDSGSYGAALQLAAATHTTPDINNVLHPGTMKYGFGISADQELKGKVGIFMRLGWNDGKTQDFAFTAIDRLATGGVSVPGSFWRRKDDVFASEFTASGLSAVHALYLSRGGLDFLIGDGALNYAPEYIWETFYSAKAPGDLLGLALFVTVDAQYVTNPAYNQARGPLWVWSMRLHLEAGGTR